MANNCPFCKKNTEERDIRSLYLSGEPVINHEFEDTKLKLKEAEEKIKLYKEDNRYLCAVVDVYKNVAVKLTKEEKDQG